MGPARRAGSGTTRNAVEGRQPNDRREAGVPVAEHRDRPCATGPAATNRWFHRNLPMCLSGHAEWRQPISSSASTIRRWSAVHRDGSVCPFWRATRSSGRHVACKCVNHTLQLGEARRERLQPEAATYVCRRSGCMVRRLQRNVHLCGNGLRVLQAARGLQHGCSGEGGRSGRSGAQTRTGRL